MNVKNNKRRQNTCGKIEKVFIELLQTMDITDITVSDICKRTDINRSTFYANYIDIYDLADKIRDKLWCEVNALYDNDAFNSVGNDYLRLFRHIRENQIFYKTYFKLGYDKSVFDVDLMRDEMRVFPEKQLSYHIEFHKAGLNAVIKKWLASGCKEEPEEMVKIIEDEYTNRR